jgi:hypothetical protein
VGSVGYVTDLIRINQGQILTELARLAARPRLQDYEFKIFSQWGEDGIIQSLVDRVAISDRTFIEFGVADFSESNCRFLLMKDNWRGYVMDGDGANIDRLRQSYYFWKHDLQARAVFITPDNINHLLTESGFDSDVGILSIDIDGLDYWVLSAIRVVRPRILIVEYNAVFGSERAISVPNIDNFVRSRAHTSWLYFGASLSAYDFWARENGYSLVGTSSSGTNAFFVRNDVRPSDLQDLTVAEAFSDSRFRESRDSNSALSFLAGAERLEAIRGLPVINVKTGAQELV